MSCVSSSSLSKSASRPCAVREANAQAIMEKMPVCRSNHLQKADQRWRYRVMTTATAIRRGGVVLYPTEGVWGLGCDPRNPQALRQLLALKRRSADKGLILLLDSLSAARPWVRVSENALPVDDSPRATTWLVPARRTCPPLLRGRFRSLAIRVTRHAPARALCTAAGGAITSTSANISGRPTPSGRWAVLRQWGPKVQAVCAAPLGGQSRPSRIFDTVSGQWIRP